MTQQITWLLRGVSGLVALVAAYWAIVFGVDALDVVTRPINQGWIEVLVLLLLPIFIGVAVLCIVAIVLGRYAWLGRIW